MPKTRCKQKKKKEEKKPKFQCKKCDEFAKKKERTLPA